MRPQIVAQAVDPASMLKIYQELDSKIDAAENDGIVRRWEFGRKMVFERGNAKKLPGRRLMALSKELGKSRSELKYRMQLADKCATKAELAKVLANYPSWWHIVSEFLPGKPAGTMSLSNEWYTPAQYVEAARQVLGGIDLDPASCTEANRTVRATRIYTEADNGLSHSWTGRVWMNPPWGGLTELFVEKLVEEHATGGVTTAVVLVNAHATDTDWFQPLWNHTLCFTNHRIDYNAPRGKKKETTSTHGSVFVYFGEDVAAFKREFEQFGPIMRRIT